MIRNGQVHNIGAHDMQAQTAFVARVFHVAASIADFRHLAPLFIVCNRPYPETIMAVTNTRQCPLAASAIGNIRPRCGL